MSSAVHATHQVISVGVAGLGALLLQVHQRGVGAVRDRHQLAVAALLHYLPLPDHCSHTLPCCWAELAWRRVRWVHEALFRVLAAFTGREEL